MNRFKTHFCLVSQQAAPNLLPLLDNEMRPEKVVLLVTEQMEKQADYLERVIRPRGIKVVHRQLRIIDDFDAMENELIDLIDNEPADEIALNVTGGTKWMAITAQEVFRSYGAAVFYVKVEDDKVLFLGDDPASHILSQRIDLNSYIKAYGYEFREHSQPRGLSQNLREVCEQLVLKVDAWQGAIGQLNLLASEAEAKKTLVFRLSSTVPRPDAELMNLIGECEMGGILQRTSEDRWSFSDENSRAWANGGWLESYVNSRLNELKGEAVIQDSPHLNLQINRIGSPSHNEIDVCFMARNRLHIIECKTKRMAGKGRVDATTETVYKLDSISELGGLGTKSMLVSYRRLGPADEQRANDLGIKVVQGAKIQQMKAILREWIVS